MALFKSVVAAVDLSDLSGRVIYHAAGLAGASSARLTILHVTDRPSTERATDLERALYAAVPYGTTYLSETDTVVEAGDVVATILRVAEERAAELIVCGSHARSALVRLLLGSTASGLLQRTDRPVFLVGPTDRDVVLLGMDHVALNLGAVLAAVDLSEDAPQLQVASGLAAVARLNLLLMTVAGDGLDEHHAAQQLRMRAHGLEPVAPHAVIVRRGDVAKEIARCAVAEGAGVVVMGLADRAGRNARPGRIAIEVLQSGRAHVLAVPK